MQRLKTSLATATDQPSCKLVEYFKQCSTNPCTRIEERLETLRQKFVDKFDAIMTTCGSVAEPRFTLGTKLYYRMLELFLNNVSKKMIVLAVFLKLTLKAAFHPCVTVYIYKPINRSE